MTKTIGTVFGAANGTDETALARLRLLRPILEESVSAPATSAASGVTEPTLSRWLWLYRLHDLAGLQRRPSSDHGQIPIMPATASKAKS